MRPMLVSMVGENRHWVNLHMNQLSLRNDRLKLIKTAGILPIVLEEFCRTYPDLIKENRRMSTCNRLDSRTLGSQLVIMPKNLLPNH